MLVIAASRIGTDGRSLVDYLATTVVLTILTVNVAIVDLDTIVADVIITLEVADVIITLEVADVVITLEVAEICVYSYIAIEVEGWRDGSEQRGCGDFRVGIGTAR